MDLVSPSDVDALLASHAAQAPTDFLPLGEALGRLLREDVRADRPFPAIDRVTMDGVAIRHARWAAGHRTFRVAGQQAAGCPPRMLDGDDACVEVMTGAPLPTGADTVIPIEQVDLRKDAATITGEIARGQFVHRCGSDAPAGALLAAAGTRLSPGVMAAAAAAGLHHVRVAQPPRVGLVDTGDELVEIAAVPAPHEMRRSNAVALAAVLRRAGVSVIHSRHARDRMADLRSTVSELLEGCDLVVLTGGISRGRFDLVAPVLAELGIRMLVHGVRQNPGKPLAFGLAPSGPAVFALPGNPVSSLLCAVRYVVPFLERGLGSAPARQRVRVASPAPPRPAWTRFDLCRLGQDPDGAPRAAPLALNTSGDLRSLAAADGFAEVTAEAGALQPWWPLREPEHGHDQASR